MNLRERLGRGPPMGRGASRGVAHARCSRPRAPGPGGVARGRPPASKRAEDDDDEVAEHVGPGGARDAAGSAPGCTDRARPGHAHGPARRARHRVASGARARPGPRELLPATRLDGHATVAFAPAPCVVADPHPPRRAGLRCPRRACAILRCVIELHHGPLSRSLRVRWLLEELFARLELLDLPAIAAGIGTCAP